MIVTEDGNVSNPEQQIFTQEVHEHRSNLKKFNRVKANVIKSNNGQIDARIGQDSPIYSSIGSGNPVLSSTSASSSYEKPLSNISINAMRDYHRDYSDFSSVYAPTPSPLTPVSTTCSIPASPDASYMNLTNSNSNDNLVSVAAHSSIHHASSHASLASPTPMPTQKLASNSALASPSASYMNLLNSRPSNDQLSAAAVTPHSSRYDTSLPSPTLLPAQKFLSNQKNIDLKASNTRSQEHEYQYEDSSGLQPSENHFSDTSSEESSNDDEAPGIVIFGTGM